MRFLRIALSWRIQLDKKIATPKHLDEALASRTRQPGFTLFHGQFERSPGLLHLQLPYPSRCVRPSDYTIGKSSRASRRDKRCWQ
jgi:hypothetical protein